MPTVLVIDDTDAAIETARKSVPDWTVLSAYDGINGLDMLKQHHETIDVVLLDLQMPRMDGRTALPQIRALYPRIPVRLWSAFVSSPDWQLTMELTGRPPIAKPISPSALAAEIYQTLGQQAPPRQEELSPHQDGEMREQALSVPVKLIICKSDRERTNILKERLRAAELDAVFLLVPLNTVHFFKQEEDDVLVVVVFYDDFQSVLPLNTPIMCVCGDMVTAIQARDQFEEFKAASGQQTPVAIIVDEPEHPDDVLSRMQFALQELLAGRSVLPE
jgi:CheY-like chemotaxis protein